MEANPISGRTRDTEIAIARFIGGRLPYDAWQSLKRETADKTPRQRTQRGAKSKRKYRQT